MTNSDFRSALTSGFHTESSKSRSREPSLDMLLLLLLRPALRLGSHWYGARWSLLAFLRRRFCCINSCRRSTLQRVSRFSVWRTRSPGQGTEDGGVVNLEILYSSRRLQTRRGCVHNVTWDFLSFLYCPKSSMTEQGDLSLLEKNK